MKYAFEVNKWFSLDIDIREHILKKIGYMVQDNYVYSVKQIFDGHYHFEHRYRYDHVGQVIVDEYSQLEDFYNPEPHTPGGIYSATKEYQIYNRTNFDNKYILIRSYRRLQTDEKLYTQK